METTTYERELDIVALTINNHCNLTCPHCYLNVAGTGDISLDVINKLFEEPPEKIAIVGMEPFYDPQSIANVRRIARRGKETETLISVVTNGLNLRKLCGAPAEEVPELIDISLDGGPATYSESRGGGKDLFRRVVSSAQAFRKAHLATLINITHTLYVENTTNESITDMMVGGRLVSPTGGIYFAPFIPPRTQGGQRRATASKLGIREMIAVLQGTPAFMEDPEAYFFIGPYNAWAFGLSMGELVALVDSYGLVSKSRIDKAVPHLSGAIRVTYDGYAINAEHALHTADYLRYRVPLKGRRLIDIYEEVKNLP